MSSYKQINPLFLGLLLVIGLFGCKDKDKLPYDVPATYSFYNVDYSGQTARQDMLEEMVSLMKAANSDGVTINAQDLKDMYANANDPFGEADLNTSGKDLESKTFSLDVAQFQTWMDEIAAASQSTSPASDGVAGRSLSSNDPSKVYLLDENGVELTQIIEKGLMGAVFYYQIAEVYLGEDKIGEAVDNTIVTPGTGTDMEHHWDEAFGYLGVATDFPTNTADVRFIGKYLNGREAILELNQKVMDAFLTGRAAISNDDMETKNVQVGIIRENVELVFAGTAIHYLNEGIADFADDAIRSHVLSEAVAFIRGLKYSPTRKITLTQIDDILATIGGNFYQVSLNDLASARDQLSSIYGLDEVKSTL